LKEVIVSNFSKTTSGSRVLFLFSWQSTKRKLEVLQSILYKPSLFRPLKFKKKDNILLLKHGFRLISKYFTFLCWPVTQQLSTDARKYDWWINLHISSLTMT
jgi:hypothetical protein